MCGCGFNSFSVLPDEGSKTRSHRGQLSVEMSRVIGA